MAGLAEEAAWEDEIYQLEQTDPVQGGEDGVDNKQAKQLANRTQYLKKVVETNSESISTINESLDEALSLFCPIGVPLPWPTDTAPDGWTIMKGQDFDTEAYPILAVAYSTGVLPDMRGMAAVGKLDSETVLAYEAGEVKSHTHAATAASTNIGSKTAASAGSHAHGITTNSDSHTTSGGVSSSRATGTNYSAATASAGVHSHTVAIGSHTHIITVGSTGNEKNTIDNVKFNWIVRMA